MRGGVKTSVEGHSGIMYENISSPEDYSPKSRIRSPKFLNHKRRFPEFCFPEFRLHEYQSPEQPFHRKTRNSKKVWKAVLSANSIVKSVSEFVLLFSRFSYRKLTVAFAQRSKVEVGNGIVFRFMTSRVQKCP